MREPRSGPLLLLVSCSCHYFLWAAADGLPAPAPATLPAPAAPAPVPAPDGPVGGTVVNWRQQHQQHQRQSLPDGSYECGMGVDNWRDWETRWTADHKAFCCNGQNRGCDDSPQASGAGQGSPFQCKVNSEAETSEWTLAKRTWCCEWEELGCTEEAKANIQWEFDCNHPVMWKPWNPFPAEHAFFCCDRWGIFLMSGGEDLTCAQIYARYRTSSSTSTTVTTTITETDNWDWHHCLSTWQTCWSLQKKNYFCKRFEIEQNWPRLDIKEMCCSILHIGCTTTTTITSLPYDCQAGYPNWEKGWSFQKKEWCCAHESRGCVKKKVKLTCSASLNEPYDCCVGFGNWWQGWSDDKKDWCCHHHARGCRFDCDAGFSNWRDGWSYSKASWCCIYKNRACDWRNHTLRGKMSEALTPLTTPVAPAPAPPTVHPMGWVIPGSWPGRTTTATWTTTSTTTFTTSSTITSTTTIPFNCDVGFFNWVRGWSYAKKTWCCVHEGRSCSFDCNADYDKWEDVWSVAKKDWCCRHESRGCPQRSNRYNCETDYDNWRTMWSPKRREWCCRFEGRGCEGGGTTSLPYDCAAGFDNCEKGWSLSKKRFCAIHEIVECGIQNPCKAELSWRSTWEDHKKKVCCTQWMRNHSWPGDAKDICCKESEVGCPLTSTTTTTSTTATFSCDQEAALEGNWSSEERKWCCDRGDDCPEPIDCLNPDQPGKWPVNKQEWCCEKKGLDCTTSTSTGTTTSTPSSTRTSTTSKEAKFELHPGINCYWRYGADALPNKDRLDGDHGVKQCLQACQKEELCEGIIIRSGRVVPEVVNRSHCWLRRNIHPDKCFPNPAYDLYLKESHQTEAESWHEEEEEEEEDEEGSREESEEELAEESTSNETAAGSSEAAPLDCKEGISNWVHGWSAYKKKWCCKTEGFPCIGVDGRRIAKENVFDGLATKARETPEESTYHPALGRSGRRPRRYQQPEDDRYNCSSLLPKSYNCAITAGWVTEWSTDKKLWCCTHNKVWCPESMKQTTTVSPETMAASHERREWCCTRKHIGCDEAVEEATYVGLDDRSSSGAWPTPTAASRSWAPAATVALTAPFLGVTTLSLVGLAAGLRSLARLRGWATRGPGAAEAMIPSSYVAVELQAPDSAQSSRNHCTE